MIAIGHFMIGFSILLSIQIVLAHFNKYTDYAFLTSFIAGIWAMIPDLAWLRSIPPKYTILLKNFHNSLYINIFFFHRRIDIVYPYDFPDDAVIYILIGFLLTLIFSVQIRERLHSQY